MYRHVYVTIRFFFFWENVFHFRCFFFRCVCFLSYIFILTRSSSGHIEIDKREKIISVRFLSFVFFFFFYIRRKIFLRFRFRFWKFSHYHQLVGESGERKSFDWKKDLFLLVSSSSSSGFNGWLPAFHRPPTTTTTVHILNFFTVWISFIQEAYSFDISYFLTST